MIRTVVFKWIYIRYLTMNKLVINYSLLDNVSKKYVILTALLLATNLL